MNIQEILSAIESASMLEIKELVDAMKEKFGVTGAVAVAGGAAPAAAAAAEEEKTEFDVILKGFDAAKKMPVLKLIRELTGLGLKESKEFVEGTAAGPKTVKEGLSKEDAEKLATQIKEAGGEVEVK